MVLSIPLLSCQIRGQIVIDILVSPQAGVGQGHMARKMAVMTYLPRAISSDLDDSSGTEAELVGPKLERDRVEAEAVRDSQHDGNSDELGEKLSCNALGGIESCSR